jgi:hypothetical protein
MKGELAKIMKLLIDKSSDLSIKPFEKNVFENNLSKITDQRKGFQNQHISIALEKFQESIVLSKENKLLIAKKSLNEGFEKIALLKYKITKRYVYTFGLAALSYWYYKKGSYDTAEKKLWNVIKIDSFLYKQGFEIFAMHQIQQLHNIARIYFRKGDFKTACELINKTLTFLLFGDSISFYENIEYKIISKDLKDEMLWQITSETITLIQMNKLNNFQEYYKIAFKDLTKFQSNTYHEKLHFQWFNLKDLYYNGKYHEFLSALPQFITDIDRNYAVYIKNIFLDLKELNSKLISEFA